MLKAALAYKTHEAKHARKTAGAFTQGNCDLMNEFYVAQLPDFYGTKWPCSYAGPLPSNESGSH